MRVLIIIFLVLSLNAVAQNRGDSLSRRTARRGASVQAPPFAGPMIIVNEKLYNGVLESIDPGTIISMQVSRDSSSIAVNRVNKGRATIFIITKPFAIKSYQEKLSLFSREYQSYLKSQNGKDDDIQYVVHNDPLEKQEATNFLYNLPPEKIIGVTFTERHWLNGNGTQKVVIIETKVGE